LLYVYIFLPLMNKKLIQKNKLLTEDYAISIRENENAVKTSFIKENNLIIPIIKPINDINIIGIISCMELRGIKNFKNQFVTNIVGKFLGNTASAAIRQTDNDDIYYLVLSQSKFYYLQFDRQGEFIRHIEFNRSLMHHIECGPVTSKEILINAAVAKYTQRFSFIYLDELQKFFFYDSLYIHPLSKISENRNADTIAVNYLFARPFQSFALEFKKI
jgi:hypothetical protein